jgi:hypothetical protein
MTTKQKIRRAVEGAKRHDAEERRKDRVLSRPTISRDDLARLSFCNSIDLPPVVNIGGERHQWVGIGWVNEGQLHGDEVEVTE